MQEISLDKIRDAFPGWDVTAQSQLSGRQLTEAELNVKGFDQCIDYLRNDFVDNVFNQDFTLLWRLIGNKQCVAVTQLEGINEVHVGAVHNPPMALIILPSNFYRLFLDSPVYQMGAIVFAGYQAIALSKEMVDDRWLRVEAHLLSYSMQQLAREKEGRFLALYLERNPSFSPSEYQQELINRFKRDKE